MTKNSRSRALAEAVDLAEKSVDTLTSHTFQLSKPVSSTRAKGRLRHEAKSRNRSVDRHTSPIAFHDNIRESREDVAMLLFDELKDLGIDGFSPNAVRRYSGNTYEFCGIATGGGNVVLLDAVRQLTPAFITAFVDETLPLFSKVYPEYRDKKLLGGIICAVVTDSTLNLAKDKGIRVISWVK